MKGVEVNVYSDAARRNSDKASGWGCVVIRPGAAPFEASGRYRSEITDSTVVSELKAAANAVHHAFKAGLIKPGDHVILRIDNQGSVQWINGEPFKRRRSNARRDCAEVVEWIKQTATMAGFDVTAAWVKGHQRADSTDPHAVHNRRADQLCGLIIGTAAFRKSRRRPHRKAREAAKVARGESVDRVVDRALNGITGGPEA